MIGAMDILASAAYVHGVLTPQLSRQPEVPRTRSESRTDSFFLHTVEEQAYRDGSLAVEAGSQRACLIAGPAYAVIAAAGKCCPV
jgi:hypothetical protein